MQKLIVIAIVFMLLQGCGSAGGNEQSAGNALGFEASFNQSFKTSFRAKFIDQCVSGAKKTSGSNLDFSTVCGCAADKLLATKSVGQLMTGPSQADVSEVAAQCAREHPMS